MSALDFDDLRTNGLLWLVNASVFHPRGFALAFVYDDDGNCIGWEMLGDGGEPWGFAEACAVHERFRDAEAFFESRRTK